MAAPWEKYAQPSPPAAPQAAGPWAKYNAPADEVPITDFPTVRATIAPEDLPWEPTKVQRADYMLTRAREVYPQLTQTPDHVLLAAIRRDKFPNVPADEFYRQAGALPPGMRAEDIEAPNPASGGSTLQIGPLDTGIPLGEGASRFVEGIGSSFAATGQGLKQLALSVGRNLTQTGYEDTDVSRAIGGMQQTAMAEEEDRRRLTAPLMETGAGFAGNVTGNVAQIVGPGVTLKGAAMVPQLSRLAPALEAGGSALLPTTVRGSAASGAGFGAAQTRVEGESLGQNVAIGAGAGLAGAGIPRVAQAAGRRIAALSPAISQGMQERAAGEALESFAQDPAAMRAALTGAPRELVPGSMPTTAELTGDIGLGGLQRTLANTPEFGNELALLREANNRARVAAVEGAFKGASREAEQAATAIRNLEARQTLRPIGSISVGNTQPIATGVARLIEKNQSAPAVREALQAVQAELPNLKTVQDAHNLRQYIGQLMSGSIENKAGGKLAKKELMTVQSLLDRQMREAFPDWGKFLRDYRAASKDIDQIKVGRNLLGRAMATEAEGGIPNLSAAQFSRAAGNMDQTVQQSTRFRGARADTTLTPEQMQVVDQVRQDLQRFARTQERGRAVGSNTAQNIIAGGRVQDVVGPVGAAVIEPVSGVALLAINQMRKTYGEKVAAIVNEAMLDPNRAAEILARLPPKSRRAITRQVAPLLNQAGSVSGRAAPPSIQE